MIRAAVLGADVSKSRSPAIHNAAFEALGVDGLYEAISVDEGTFHARAKQLCSNGYLYLNVTIPHKQAAVKLANAQGPEVRASGAANTLLFSSPVGPVRAENTDGAGLIAALRDLGVSVAGKTIVMVGAGGAAAGATEALTRAGATIRIIARRAEIARTMRRRLPVEQRRCVQVDLWTPSILAKALAEADVLVSAVPALAWTETEAREGLSALTPDTAVLEMAYGSPTPLAHEVKSFTDRYSDGLRMLVHQAARTVELALKEAPPFEPLLRAAVAAF
jgi:shikimate dehydrogenase